MLPLDPPDVIRVPDDEDPELREAMDGHLLDLCEDEELVGSVRRVLEVAGSPESRLAQVLAVVGPAAR